MYGTHDGVLVLNITILQRHILRSGIQLVAMPHTYSSSIVHIPCIICLNECIGERRSTHRKSTTRLGVNVSTAPMA